MLVKLTPGAVNPESRNEKKTWLPVGLRIESIATAVDVPEITPLLL